MGPIVVHVTFSLLYFCKAEVAPVFVQTGKDLLMEVKEAGTLEDTDILTWSVIGSTNIARLYSGKVQYFRDFSLRAELFPKNYSLMLRSLKKSDSGLYRARVSSDKDTDVAELMVTVLDPVSPVKLTVKSCSSDSSNLTVICSTQDSLISTTFTCDNQTCSEERAEFTTPAASLKVYLEKDAIVCVHSNQVSRSEDVRKIEQFKDLCKKLTDSKHLHTWVIAIVVPILFFIVITLVAVFFYRRKKSRYKRECVGDTVYDLPLVVGELPEQRPTDDASPTGLSTVYSCSENPRVTEASPQDGGETSPESLYASVQKAKKS